MILKHLSEIGRQTPANSCKIRNPRNPRNPRATKRRHFLPETRQMEKETRQQQATAPPTLPLRGLEPHKQ